ncbi:hypothetical protein BEL04_09320 [Mucilaginibacter sp. PPCGB 2223]|uniref:hypothetical protein n=1 Tax=Mucilaginibacter sp. PPCGB 2223 TaxID=1886027 RepID=UPI000825A511|nr:hypothetical protein [Mucilaginibacter sp. PPCGB 2223]OCX54433.1 hypothetical protein BEL04_09320 [Mucilaginibacter sp. PPCGB 2223]
MKTISLKLFGCLLLITAAFSSCKKTDDTNASSQISFGLTSDSPLATFSVPGSIAVNSLVTMGPPLGTAGITWTSGIANIARFQLEAKKDGKSTEISTAGVTHVDLFALNSALANVRIDAGTYTEIELRVVFEKVAAGDLPLVLKGTYTTKAGTNIPVEFDFNDNLLIKASAENLVVDGTKNLGASLTVHLAKLLATITAAEIDATTRTNNTILITSSINTNVYNKIIAALTSCSDSKPFEKHDK